MKIELTVDEFRQLVGVDATAEVATVYPHLEPISLHDDKPGLTLSVSESGRLVVNGEIEADGFHLSPEAGEAQRQKLAEMLAQTLADTINS